MKLREYEEIEGLWHNKTIDYFKEKGCFNEDVEWVVTEKIHGSNFSFYYNGTEMKFASRGQFIENPSSFFRSDVIVEKYSENIKQLYEYLNTEYITPTKELIVYGELFGGLFPNIKSKYKKIQKGVFYTPDLEFYVFDICIDGYYLAVDDVVQVCKDNGLFSIEILKSGSFNEIKDYPNDFPSTISKRLGLPEIEGNSCEGIVIKPNINITLNETRVILKSKNDKFKEVSRSSTDRIAENEAIKEELKPIISKLHEYITENRLRNVLSKIGTLTKKDFGKVLKLFKEDILKDYEKDGNMFNITEDDKKYIDSNINRMCADIFRPIFLSEAE